ncbi:MFS transporter [Actinacidiphila bryophytorum]|uniref:Drug resistance transporter, EmrB/QacA subfamily n=1 Tax=Actinacidiphila bryophytorum TaxID=1436133 RepID=A0A9W4H7N6_9ACTN|nr:MFS transporter [Actinacidiphila bryophytorum]MBM9438328.1 MFS transporter [Actinacidiphila bryophytorum]MBN6542647.1 MFS transporter [Actinacidiphila bryophytorum]CAG7658033.1 Drug resistance transporter, EmrB/QacA subfamily [Actinacidiphila bryophytorum]
MNDSDTDARAAAGRNGSVDRPSQAAKGSAGGRAPGERPIRHGLVLFLTCLALGAVVSAMASLNVALPSLARETHASQMQLSWVIDAYSLAFAALLLPAGALGDRFGRKRALLAGLVIFATGSLLAMFTTDAHQLIALRALLGAGAALVMPATLSTITSTFPAAQRTRAVSVWTAVAGASAVLGLLVTGSLLEQWSWRSAFLLNMVLAVVAAVGTLLFVPESAEPDQPRLDVVGALITVAGLLALVYSVIEAPTRGWSDPLTIGGIVVGFVVLAGFVAWELRREHPLLDPRLFRTNPRFAAGSLSITLQFFAFFGFIFVVMQYLQLVRGDSALVAAVSALPMAGAMVPVTRLTPKLIEKTGKVAAPWIAGLLLIAVAMGVLSQLRQDSSYGLIVGGLIPLGAGIGLAMTPATTEITDALPRALQNVGSAMNDLSRELGGALGIAVLGSLLNAGYRGNLDLPDNLPPQAAAAAHASVAGAVVIGGPVAQSARAAFCDGLEQALLAGVGVALLAALLVGLLLRGTKPQPPEGAEDMTAGESERLGRAVTEPLVRGTR